MDPTVYRVIESHKNGEKLVKYWDHLPHPLPVVPHTAEEFIEEAGKSVKEDRPIGIEYYVSFANSGEEIRADAAKAFLSERNHILRRTLAEYFIGGRFIPYSYASKPLFPVDPSDVLARAKEWDARKHPLDGGYYSEFDMALMLLTGVSYKSDELRAYGLDLIRAYKWNADDRRARKMAYYGICFAYGANYQKGDEKELEEWLLSGDGELKRAVYETVLSNIDGDLADYPTEFLKKVLDQCDARDRLSIVRVLSQKELLSKKWCEALRFDGIEPVRQIANGVLSKDLT